MLSSVITSEASDVKAARTLPCEEIKHSRDTQHWLEQQSKFEACNKHYIRPLDNKNCTVENKGDSAEELHSVEWVKWICEIMCSRMVSGLWAQSTGCMSVELSVESDSWNYCKCSVCITNSFNCFICSTINTVFCTTKGLAVTIHCGPYKGQFLFLAVVLPVYHSYWFWPCSTSFILPWIWLSVPYSLWK